MLIDYVKVYQEGELSIEENTNSQQSVRVYPNPSSDVIYVQTKTTPDSLQLFDLSGKKVRTQQINSTSVNVSDVTPGIYFLVITSNNQEILEKVIIN